MIELAQQRAPSATFHVHDLGRPLDWLADGSFDIVLFALALEYVDDKVAALREFHRVLRPGSALALSRQHPTGDWLRHGGNYFTPRMIEETWSRGWQLTYWLEPLEKTCEDLHRAGFLIERPMEPRPAPAAAAIDQDKYDRLCREPTGLLAIRAVPDPRKSHL